MERATEITVVLVILMIALPGTLLAISVSRGTSKPVNGIVFLSTTADRTDSVGIG